MQHQGTTKEDINKLIEFRQAVYEKGITLRKDALMNVVDAVISQGVVSSFAMLSQAEAFQRK